MFIMVDFFQWAHLQFEQRQSAHEHIEPQLVFSSIKNNRIMRNIYFNVRNIREHDLQSHLHAQLSSHLHGSP